MVHSGPVCLLAPLSLLAACVPDAQPMDPVSGGGPVAPPAGCEVGTVLEVADDAGATSSAYVRGSDGAVLLAHLSASAPFDPTRVEGATPTPCGDDGHLRIDATTWYLTDRELSLSCGGRADAPSRQVVLASLPTTPTDLEVCDCDGATACERWLWLWTPASCAEAFQRLGPPEEAAQDPSAERVIVSRWIAPGGPSASRGLAACSYEPQWEDGARGYTQVLGYVEGGASTALQRSPHYDEALAWARLGRGYVYGTYVRGWHATAFFPRLRFRCGSQLDGARLDIETSRPLVADFLLGADIVPPPAENSFFDYEPGSFLGGNSFAWGTSLSEVGTDGTGRWGDGAAGPPGEDRIAVHPMLISPSTKLTSAAFKVATSGSRCDDLAEDVSDFWEVWVR